MSNTTTTDKLVASGTNENNVKWEVYKDHSIGDFYLIAGGGSRPVFTGSKKSCISMASGWVA